MMVAYRHGALKRSARLCGTPRHTDRGHDYICQSVRLLSSNHRIMSHTYLTHNYTSHDRLCQYQRGHNDVDHQSTANNNKAYSKIGASPWNTAPSVHASIGQNYVCHNSSGHKRFHAKTIIRCTGRSVRSRGAPQH